MNYFLDALFARPSALFLCVASLLVPTLLHAGNGVGISGQQMETHLRPANLVIADIWLAPGSGTPVIDTGKVAVYVKVKNIGGTTYATNSYVDAHVYSIEKNGSGPIATNHRVVPGTNLTRLINWVEIPPLAPGKEYTVKSRMITLHYLGFHKVVAKVTADAEQPSLKQDNVKSHFFQTMGLKAPDLVVCFPKHIKSQVSARTKYRVKVKNIGNAKSGQANLRFRIQHKGRKHYTIPPLEPNQEHKVTRSVYWAKKGSNNFSLHVDSRDQVVEYPPKGENNNLLKGTICVTAGDPTNPYCMNAIFVDDYVDTCTDSRYLPLH